MADNCIASLSELTVGFPASSKTGLFLLTDKKIYAVQIKAYLDQVPEEP